jgi:hypothetical protein
MCIIDNNLSAEYLAVVMIYFHTKVYMQSANGCYYIQTEICTQFPAYQSIIKILGFRSQAFLLILNKKIIKLCQHGGDQLPEYGCRINSRHIYISSNGQYLT